jgi:hypothetical protein
MISIVQNCVSTPGDDSQESEALESTAQSVC